MSASGTRAAAVTAVRVPGGLPTEMLKLTGRGGARDVTITGPRGIRASSAAGDDVRQAPFVIMRSPQLDTTYIAIVHPRADRYAITANPGSPAIARVLGAHGFTPVVHARVTGRGRTRRLVFAARTVPGEKVEFLERGAHSGVCG